MIQSFADISKLREKMLLSTIQDNNNKENILSSLGKTEFLDLLEKGIKEVNVAGREAEKSSMDLASGRSSNIHETMLSVTKAELSFNMIVQMRNKVIEAYQEVMRMQV
jgi:flagellar hook-basal body complex protein FliE